MLIFRQQLETITDRCGRKMLSQSNQNVTSTITSVLMAIIHINPGKQTPSVFPPLFRDNWHGLCTN